MADFETLVKDLIEAEGGDELVTNVDDRGGLTKYGISQRAYPDLDIASLTEEEAIEIYKRDYWDKFKIGDMPDKYKRDIFFNVVNSGSSAIRDLQQALGVDVDGVVGPQTKGALEKFDGDLTRTIKEGQIDRYVRIAEKDPTQRQFLNGWINRAVGSYRFSKESEDLRDLSPDQIKQKALSALDETEVQRPGPTRETYPQIDPTGFLANLSEILKQGVNSRQAQPQEPESARMEEEQPSITADSLIRSLAERKVGARNSNEAKLKRTANEAKLEAEARKEGYKPTEQNADSLIRKLAEMKVVKEKTYDRSSLNKPTSKPEEKLAGGRDGSKDPIFGIF